MGMTRAFYFIKKQQLTEEEAQVKERQLSGLYGEKATVFYLPQAEWIPLYAQGLCEGTYAISDEELQLLEEIFNGPIVMFSIFDDTVLLVCVSLKEKIYKYVHNDYGEFYDYINSVPEALYQCGLNKEELNKVWKEKKVDELTRLYMLANLLGVDPVFEGNKENEE